MTAKMKVPLLDLGLQHQTLKAKFTDAFDRICESHQFILGPEVAQLEERVAGYCQCAHGIGVSSGTDALLLALMAMNVGANDEVITSAYSFFATAGAIARVGAKPVFIDIEPHTFNLDPEKLEAQITANTQAIIPVHLFGQCADMDSVIDIANNYGIPVIEDTAQAIGSEYLYRRRAGSMGLVGCLSFFPSKNLGALGDAGMLITNVELLAEKLRILRVHGSQPKYYHQFIGGNFRIDTLQAAWLNIKFDYLDGWSLKRQENAGRYNRWFADVGLAGNEIILPQAVYQGFDWDHYHIYNQYVIRARKRDELRAYLTQHGVGNEVYYPVPLHLQPCFAYLGYKAGDFPEAEKAALESLAIPIFPELTEAQQHYVVDTINAFYKE